ncbi:MAG: aminodeoxychorismate synthase component I [Proteobacteria bacterium]|nr:aminodeoxychorismate synthase component I [Pseudomonadota bacterium]
MTFRLTELPYRRDSSLLFTPLANEHWSIFLDSGYPYIDLGRYDIIAARPYITLKTFADETEIVYANGKNEHSSDDPFSLVKTLLGENENKLSTVPFAGGALGYFAYDLGRRIEKIPDTSKHDINMPEMAIGIYDWAVVTDHQQRRTWLTGYGKDERTFDEWDELLDLFQTNTELVTSKTSTQEFEVRSDLQANMDDERYARAFNKIKHYIREGDCYQVNLAQRFAIDVACDPWPAYLKLRRLNPAPYSGFFNISEGTVLSTSPERFLKVDNGLVESKPIKGTRRRSSDVYEDRALSEDLLESKKDRAENLMIVDLLRNDIGKSCRSGSVSVPRLFALESFARVHHLVSTVIGQLAENTHALDLLRGCFPGGSITGAPKLRAMEIIEELEPHRRSIYCGSMAYIGFDGNMDSNITIRTLLHHKDRMYCWAGGGIVTDSRLDAEYQECFDKASALFALFEIEKP